MHRGNSCECIIYIKIIVIYIHLGTKCFCGQGGIYKGMKLGKEVIQVIRWFLDQIIPLFFIHDLLGILTNTL